MSQPPEDFSLEEARLVLLYLEEMYKKEYTRKSSKVAADLKSM